MEEVILFLLTFIVVYLFYQIFLIIPVKRGLKEKKKRKERKELLEIRYLKAKYRLDFTKISYPQILQICALVSSFDISVAVSVVAHVESFLWEIVVGFVIVSILIFVSYHLVYLFYERKGMVKNG